MSNDKTYWFVWAKEDAHTNCVISMMKDVLLAEYPEMLCADGKIRNLWEVSSAGIDGLVKSRRDLGLDFRLFKRRGNNGKIYPVDFRD